MAIGVLQIVGSGIVLVGSTALGRARAERFRVRPLELRGLAALLRALCADISYARVPLVEALRRASRQSGGPETVTALFDSMVRSMEQPGVTGQQAWAMAMESVVKLTALSAEDQEILKALGATVGTTGPEEQVGHIQAALSLLDAREREAIEEREKYRRLYQTVGVLSGLLIVILFI